jgi:hypothetical protein
MMQMRRETPGDGPWTLDVVRRAAWLLGVRAASAPSKRSPGRAARPRRNPVLATAREDMW